MDFLISFLLWAVLGGRFGWWQRRSLSSVAIGVGVALFSGLLWRPLFHVTPQQVEGHTYYDAYVLDFLAFNVFSAACGVIPAFAFVIRPLWNRSTKQ